MFAFNTLFHHSIGKFFCAGALVDNEFIEITSYLWQLEKVHVYHAFRTSVGPQSPFHKDLKNSYTFLDDVISSWLWKEDISISNSVLESQAEVQ